MLFSKFVDTLTEEHLRGRDNTLIELQKQESKRKRVSSDGSDDTVKKYKSKRLRVVSGGSDDTVKKDKSKRLHVVSDGSDDTVKKDKSKRLCVVSDGSDDTVKKDKSNKILLRECKRHTVCRVECTYFNERERLKLKSMRFALLRSLL